MADSPGGVRVVIVWGGGGVDGAYGVVEQLQAKLLNIIDRAHDVVPPPVRFAALLKIHLVR